MDVFVETKINKIVRGGDSEWHEFLSFSAHTPERLDAGFNNAQNFLRYLYKEYQGSLSHRYIVDGVIMNKNDILKLGDAKWKN